MNQYSFCQKHNFTPKYSIVVDTSIGKEMLRQCSRCTPKHIDGYWKPSEFDIKVLERNFNKIYRVKSLKGHGDRETVDSLKYFSFQYLGVLIHKHKYIYINAFPAGGEKDYLIRNIDFSKVAYKVCDGGYNFWGILFNLKSLKFRELVFNGRG